MIDWDKIEHDYVTGDLSMRGIAKKYGLNAKTVMTRASRGNWASAKAEHESRVKDEVENLKAKRKEALAIRQAPERLSEMDMLKTAVGRLLEKTMTAIEDIDKKYVGGETITVPVQTKDIKRLTSAVKDLADILGYTAVTEDDTEGGVILMPVVMERG